MSETKAASSSSKRVTAFEDLALYGASPAYQEPVHVGRPNIGSKDEFLSLVDDMFERKWLTNNGPLVQQFEADIASYLGVNHCIAVCNGTVALEMAIRGLDLSGEVIVPSYTFIATAHSLRWQGLTPVFADIDPATHNLDPKSVEKAITERTTGILGVHLWGRPAPIRELSAIAEDANLELFFDAAHALGCSVEGRMIGNFGRCEVLSFHATKFFNSFEGGAIVTNDDKLAQRLKLIRNFGFAGYDNVVEMGTNGKMTEVCAAMGIVNLKHVAAVVETNRANHEHYRSRLEEVEGLSLLRYDEAEANNYQYVVVELDEGLKEKRDFIVDALHHENVLARKYFWPGCHRMEPYATLEPFVGDRLPVTESVSERVVVLPTGKSIDKADIDLITDVIRVCVSK